MSLINKRCNTCAYVDMEHAVCRLSFRTIIPDKDFCPSHEILPMSCDVCHRITPKAEYIIYNEYIICANCAPQLRTCALCCHNQNCAFETDPSPLPKIIQQKIQRGNMTIVNQVRNPEREAVTCQKNCKCYSETFGCMRRFNHCECAEAPM